MSHLNQAMHDLVHKSVMSAKEISDALGIGRQVLTNKVNPNHTFNKLSVHELHAIQILTGNDVVLRAMQAEFVLSIMAEAPPSIVEAMISQGKECGDVFAAVQNALADNKLTDYECSDILKEIREAIRSLEITEQAVINHRLAIAG